MDDFLIRLLGSGLFFLLVLGVFLSRRLTDRAQVAQAEAAAEHDPLSCHMCAPYRHPSKSAARRRLSLFPHQTRGGSR